ncbi:MAG: nucleoside-diphosphate sugar epimerase/dehydratase [Clostridia bacterium]|nr:nucleoside-diphosphate sugar epimerase/dehydratase [Clostridia bacterium]
MKETKTNLKRKSDFGRVLSTVVMVILDAVIVNAAGFLALLVRFEFDYAELAETQFLKAFLNAAPASTVATIAFFMIFRLYSVVWEYAGLNDMIRLFIACILSTGFDWLYIRISPYTVPRSYSILRYLILVTIFVCVRFSGRLSRGMFLFSKKGAKKRTMLIGAGQSGDIVLREMQSSTHAKNNIVCIIDDDRMKVGKRIRNVRIIGTREDIVSAVKKYRIEEIIFAIPSATAEQRRSLVKICQQTDCKLLTLPAIYQLANGEVSVQKIRSVDVLDLLGRDAIKINLDEISGYLGGKTVIVTGGGGSIGSELCRQIAKHNIKKLVIFDIYENNAYSIQQELLKNYPELSLEVLIGSVRDQKRVFEIFEKYRPDIVFHAAAHKHVPLMEDSPAEAIKNNVFGTYNVALAADRFGAKKMVLISTDKAVNPTNVMGASKRICEMIIEMMSKKSKTVFAAVRFGNVLGSNGSVIPLFKKQIANGGPVTVTHKDIIRYFMTIPEAVSLVLQAGSYAKDGEIFVLDMGEPVRIDDLARNMIRLSGFEPDVDIKIKYTGLRPGEKLYEELLLDTEGIEKTENDLIFIGHPVGIDESKLLSHLSVLESAQDMTGEELRKEVSSVVKEYSYERN